MNRTYEEYLQKAEMEAEGGFHSKSRQKEATRLLDDAFRTLKMRDIPTGEFHGETFDNFGVQFPTHPELIGKEIMEYQSVDIWNFKPEKHLSEYHENDRPKVMKLYELWHKYKSMGITAKPKVKREIKFTDKQATHWGTCQICGKHHKADRKTNRVASHGYVMPWKWGGQYGHCEGSKHLPLELSCKAVEEQIGFLRVWIKKYTDMAVDGIFNGQETKVVITTVHTPSGTKKQKEPLEWKINRLNDAINRYQDVVDNWVKKDLIPIEVWQ